MIKVAITSIGSGVGQSVVDSCRNSNFPLELYGLGMNPLGFGAFDCDYRLHLPTIYDMSYVDKLLIHAKKYKFNIIIPGLDDELLLLSERIDEFHALGIEIPVASPNLIKLCRDKGLMSRELLQYSPAFVQSFTNEYIQNNKATLPYPLIAKPNSGFASRNIFAINNPCDLDKLESFHVVQTLAVPKKGSLNRENFLKALKKGHILQVDEISVQLLFAKDGTELGRMASYNKLQNGVPIEIIPIDDKTLWEEIDIIIPKLKELGLNGPINIQGRLTDDGFRIFEMNPRFTGITGLRSLMGFNEVEAIIRDYCSISAPSSPLTINDRKIGIRQVANRVIDIQKDIALQTEVNKIQEYNSTCEEKVTILITGANSYLGIETITELLKSEKVAQIKALVRNAERFKENDFFPKEVEVYDIKDFYDGSIAFGMIDIVCHMASGRPIHGNDEVATSLSFTSALMNSITTHQIPAVINLSSQAVYGDTQTEMWKETSKIQPSTAYAQNKWASELLCENTKKINNITAHTSIRLSRIIGPSKAMDLSVLPHLFIKKAINKEALTIEGGKQTFDFLNVNDAALSIVKLVEIPFSQWPETLNIGSGVQITLLEMTKLIAKITKEQLNKELKYTLKEKNIDLAFGMNINKAKESIDWKPTISLEDSLISICNYMATHSDV